MSHAGEVPPQDRIPRVDRDKIDELFAITPRAKRRPVAHVLTILGFTADGPTYTFECRAPAVDLAKPCTAWVTCGCDRKKYLDADGDLIDRICPSGPTGLHELREGQIWHKVCGCMIAWPSNEFLDDEVQTMVNDQRLGRGVYLTEARWLFSRDEVELTLIAQVEVYGNELRGAEGLDVEPTSKTRYPGYGPEVDLRELIEHALSEELDAVMFDEDRNVAIVDANAAAKAVLAWIEEHYDIPPNQQTLPLLPPRQPSRPRVPTSRIATIHPIGGAL